MWRFAPRLARLALTSNWLGAALCGVVPRSGTLWRIFKKGNPQCCRARLYGKAAIVGVAGEIEHGAAMIHPRLGQPMREAVGGGEAIISSNVKFFFTWYVYRCPIGT